jgi:NADPH:quinone reductase-like Zn-dependent oxidoreductase
MDAYRIAKFGLDALERISSPIPETPPGAVLLRIHAVSLNYRDLMVVEGAYNPRMALPRIPCSDAAGEIVAIGEGVTRVTTGDRVCTLFMQRWFEGPISAANSTNALGGDIDGVLAEYLVLPEDGVIPFPPHLTCEEAATLPCAALTAWNALHHAGDPISPARQGDTILLQGTGGVSLFALQFARLLGAKPFLISSSDEKLARATALGLEASCNYRQTPDWSKWIAELTSKRGVDRIIEVGGAGTLPHSLKAIRPGGLIAQIGVLSGGAAATEIPLGPILHKQIRLQGIYVGSRAMFAEMNAAIAAAQLHPIIDRIFPFEEAPEAIAAIKTAGHFGKIVIQVAPA